MDGDNQPETVVIGTGETWTNETPMIHAFEYEHQMIVRGLLGDKSYVAFTPAFIEYYYANESFPSSLIYMATCHATYDDSMAQAFIDAGASVYMGWTRDTVFWTNSWTSVFAIRLLVHGLSVHQTCSVIRSGGLCNFLFRSQLTYVGDGDYTISTAYRDL